MMKKIAIEISLAYLKLLYIINVLVFHCIEIEIGDKNIILTRSETNYAEKYLCEANLINQCFLLYGILVLHKCGITKIQSLDESLVCRKIDIS